MTRLALVTGGTRGIGAAISVTLKQAGYKVVANYVDNEARASQFGKENDIRVYKCDIRNFEGCRQIVEQIENDMGQHIEILVNNAGISRDSMLHKMTQEQWYEVISTNLDSCYNMTRNVIEKMRKHEFGRIVNISSINGQTGQLGLTNYCATKAGIIGFTRALALETASKNITVNSIAPGYIKTDLLANLSEKVIDNIKASIPVGDLGRPEDIARAVKFLVEDAAWFITGTTLAINGGQHMS